MSIEVRFRRADFSEGGWRRQDSGGECKGKCKGTEDNRSSPFPRVLPLAVPLPFQGTHPVQTQTAINRYPSVPSRRVTTAEMNT